MRASDMVGGKGERGKTGYLPKGKPGRQQTFFSLSSAGWGGAFHLALGAGGCFGREDPL